MHSADWTGYWTATRIDGDCYMRQLQSRCLRSWKLTFPQVELWGFEPQTSCMPYETGR